MVEFWIYFEDHTNVIVDRSDVACERGVKDDSKNLGLSSEKDGVAINQNRGDCEKSTFGEQMSSVLEVVSLRCLLDILVELTFRCGLQEKGLDQR